MTQIGSANHRAKLNEAMVRAIRRTWAQNKYKCAHCGHYPRVTIAELCRTYGVNMTTMQRVVSKLSWRHVSLTRPDAEAEMSVTGIEDGEGEE